MDWPSYLRKVVSTAAGAAAGVAAGVGGPIAAASANVAAEKVSDDLLKQFLGAHDDQMQRIEEISLEMRNQLIGLQNTVGGLLDAPWRTALAHIQEASRRPLRRAQELELARIRLFDAWGLAESLLERDPRSLDPAALRCPLVAQQIAAVYSFLGEPQNTVYWLEAAYTTSRNQLDNQVGVVHDIFVQKMKGAYGIPSRRWGKTWDMKITVLLSDPESKDPLWVRAPDSPSMRLVQFPEPPGGGLRHQYSKTIWVKVDLDFVGRLMALVALDAEAQLLRLACLDAGADGNALRPGTEPRSASIDSAREGERRALLGDCTLMVRPYDEYYYLRVLVVFDATTAAQVKVDLFESEKPVQQLIDDRYRQILPIELGSSDFPEWWPIGLPWRPGLRFPEI